MTRRRTLGRGAMVAALVLLTMGFVALGLWQVQRRAWKHALVAFTERRIHAAATELPGERAWPHVNEAHDAYTRVRATGHYVPGKDIRVRAVSDLGSGYWVMTPLDTGPCIVLINRGFVPQRTDGSPAPTGRVVVTGLLRIGEPGGGFLRANDPSGDRWFSRDVAAIAQSRRLSPVAPYFVDADATPGQNYPVGGLTVVRFSDHHLVYALTWFALAAMSLAGIGLLVRRARRFRGETATMPNHG